MGKIAYRRVAPNWEHPRDAKGRFIPLMDGTQLVAHQQHWDECRKRWEESNEVYTLIGVRTDGRDLHGWTKRDGHALDMSMEHYYGDRPVATDYTPAWTIQEATAWQVYEEVTPGTPISEVYPDLDTMARKIAHLYGHSFGAMKAKILASVNEGKWYVPVKEFEPGGTHYEDVNTKKEAGMFVLRLVLENAILYFASLEFDPDNPQKDTVQWVKLGNRLQSFVDAESAKRALDQILSGVFHYVEVDDSEAKIAGAQYVPPAVKIGSHWQFQIIDLTDMLVNHSHMCFDPDYDVK
jgi:hypothetical protein